MSLRYLKIKIKSLGAEIQMIHKEEHKAKSAYRYSMTKQGLEERYKKDHAEFWGLRNHRNELSPDVRAALVAYGFLRGRTYEQVETPTLKNPPNWEKVTRLAIKYGPEYKEPVNVEEKIKEWRGY